MFMPSGLQLALHSAQLYKYHLDVHSNFGNKIERRSNFVFKNAAAAVGDDTQKGRMTNSEYLVMLCGGWKNAEMMVK